MNGIFDTETTGVFGKNEDAEVDYMTFPYIVQIAWKVGELEKKFLIYQEGREIPEGASRVHGITTAMGNDRDITHPMKVVLAEFMIDFSETEKVIGHNIYFDVQIAKANVFREFGPTSPEAIVIKAILDKSKRICTMRRGTGLDPALRGKWPKLIELYKFLFKEEFDGAHDALGDLRATERCHHRLIEMGR